MMGANPTFFFSKKTIAYTGNTTSSKLFSISATGLLQSIACHSNDPKEYWTLVVEKGHGA
jgi:hypothetical protein